jgi:1,4-alpha-glucan branching enzyme
MNSQPKGYLCLVLHAHLPYIRHPEHEYFLEENWLYEAMTETYIPLLDIISRLIDDSIDFRMTFSFSPTLVEMLNDNLLMERYVRHIERLIELAEKEVYRTRGDIHFGPLAGMYLERFLKVRHLFEDVYAKDIVSGFRALQEAGMIEIITTAATHAFLPNLSLHPQAVKAQIKIGSEQYRKYFFRPAEGIWLPECGFMPGFDRYVMDEKIRYFFLETHGILHAGPAPRYGVYAPILCPSGVAAFGRDTETSKQVWSSVGGYPGDFDYRDFYRDIGYDLDPDHVKPFIGPYGTRTYTGLKYYRVTGRTEDKRPYIRRRALEKAVEHADNFIYNRERQIQGLSETLKIRPVVTAIYDAELFGHWWFEGPEWLDFLLRGMTAGHRNFKTITPSEYLSPQYCRTENLQVCEPSMSSWGNKGYSEVWLNDSNDYLYRHLLKATERMIYLAEKYKNAKGILQRALNQAAREILLAQQSDWTFIMQNGSAVEYAKKRIEEHIGRFSFLYKAILSGDVHDRLLEEMEGKYAIFQDIDYRVYSGLRQ